MKTFHVLVLFRLCQYRHDRVYNEMPELPFRLYRFFSSPASSPACLPCFNNRIAKLYFMFDKTIRNLCVLAQSRNAMEESRMERTVLYQRIENRREPKNKYSTETKSCGIVPLRNCNRPSTSTSSRSTRTSSRSTRRTRRPTSTSASSRSSPPPSLSSPTLSL